MKPNRTLIGTITERASVSYPVKITEENYKDWENHWLKTAEEYRDEFIAEGLMKTADAVQEIIDFNLEWGS